MLRATKETYQHMNDILTRIRDALVIPRNQPENKHIIQEIPVQEGPINNNNPKNEVNVPTQLMNYREQPNPILVNRYQNADKALVHME